MVRRAKAEKKKVKRIRVTSDAVDQARKKIKETPKRGRWANYGSIIDFDDYIRLYNSPTSRHIFSEDGIVVFDKMVEQKTVLGHPMDKQLKLKTEEVEITNCLIRFTCDSYNGSEMAINDHHCCGKYGAYTAKDLACPRISCPFYGVGFITKTLKEATYKEKVDQYLKKIHKTL